MDTFRRLATVWLFLGSAVALGQTENGSSIDDESEALKLAAVEALIAAPPDKALPIVTKVLEGNGSDALKERALFVLSQIDLPEAHTLLVETARFADGSLRYEAIRMVGIGGDPEALAGLSELHASGDRATREAVLEAYLIADDKDAVYRIAANARDREEFEAAVEILGAMGALDQLRALRDRIDMSETLIEAYAVAGDTDSLRELAMDGSDPERQAQAIQGLGIAGADPQILVDIYRSTDSPTVKEAVREGLLIGGHDQAMLELFRETRDSAEKRELLETLVIMDSEAVWDIIDSTLENGQ
jgi:HEAT repeat protein